MDYLVNFRSVQTPLNGQFSIGANMDIFRPEIESLLANGSTQRFIAQRYHTTEANLHNWLKKNGIKPGKAHTASRVNGSTQ